MRQIYSRKFLAYLLSLLLSFKSVSTFFFPPLGGGLGGGGGGGCGCGGPQICGGGCGGGFGGGFQQPCYQQQSYGLGQQIGCNSGCGGGFGGLGGLGGCQQGISTGCSQSYGNIGGLGGTSGCGGGLANPGLPPGLAPLPQQQYQSQAFVQPAQQTPPFVQAPSPTQVQTPVAPAQPPQVSPDQSVSYVNTAIPSNEPSGYEYRNPDPPEHSQPPPPPPPPPNPPQPYTQPTYTSHTTTNYNSYASDNVDKEKSGNDITSIDNIGDKVAKVVTTTQTSEDFYEDKVPDIDDTEPNSTGGKKETKPDLLSPDYSENSFKTKISGVPSDPMATDPDATGDPKCSSETLRLIMHENIVSSPTISKQLIFSAGRLAFGQTIDVICSRNKFSYTVVSSKIFCEASRGRITCFAFLQP
ncbi:unnamed protein product [Bursaphelenchus xylophilus]|uniref:(pine wood nematode) hypothetical protein n=1 Tax=Bursaphelenchus xylophilus TaxID=6326 RepID=A0A1I7RP06_BURXY|nr:unnamed protein product [Bursaphelenchus xylophilus]CAG9124428.1 unnamed protein product [Bursaphelenchus xylophilus]